MDGLSGLMELYFRMVEGRIVEFSIVLSEALFEYVR